MARPLTPINFRCGLRLGLHAGGGLLGSRAAHRLFTGYARVRCSAGRPGATLIAPPAPKIGVADRDRHQAPRIAQIHGVPVGSFNTREFFHGRPPGTLRWVKWAFLTAAFAVPALLLAAALFGSSAALLALAFVVQFAGLVAERWFFFAEANHPQNLYYQAVA